MNNAGVVNFDTLSRTRDGYKMHMATNHYGHFALTAHLFEVLCRTPYARIVILSSLAYTAGEIRFDDMDWHERAYSRTKAYGDSKLANLLFMRSLQKRLDRAGATAGVGVAAAHPGLTGTERQQSIGIGGQLAKWIASPVQVGVAPQLLAATVPNVGKCSFYASPFFIRGRPVKIETKDSVKDDILAEQLWSFTEKVTGCGMDVN